ncbi:MAG: MipA/OmpV family protein [Pseudomonadota bacterium]
MNNTTRTATAAAKRNTSNIAFMVGTFTLLLMSAPANSESADTEPTTGWSSEFGAALLANTEYQGASSYDVMAFPYFDFRYFDEKGEKYFANVPQGFGAYLFREQQDNGRQSRVFVSIAPAFVDRDPDDFDGLDTFGIGVQARLGWELERGPFAVSAVVGQELGAGHEGLTVDLSADSRTRLSERSFLSVGPTIRWGNSTYMENLYGVTPTESVNTDLSEFEAGSGLDSAGIQAVLGVPVAGDWRLTSVLQVSRLLGDAADTSLTPEPNQVLFFTALTRRF